VVKLEHEADGGAAQPREAGVVQRLGLLVRNLQRAGGGPLQQADDVEQRALASSANCQASSTNTAPTSATAPRWRSNFREKFEALNRVRLTDGEFARLLDEIVTPDVFTAAKTLRSINAFTRDDGTPLNYTLVNIKDWCKNTFEVVNQLASTPTTATTATT
jgi:type I site-specific restriction-modification system R (restriction) subunit